jgi:hypothetical protein
MRNAFYDWTGVNHFQQVELEDYLSKATVKGRVVLNHPILDRLLQVGV